MYSKLPNKFSFINWSLGLTVTATKAEFFLLYLESILILILVSIIQAILTMAPFYNRIVGEIRKLEGDDKVHAKLMKSY